MKKYIILAATSVVSAAAGAVGGYVLARRKLNEEYNARLEKEIEDTKRFYAMMHRRGAFKTPEDAVNALIPEVFPDHDEPTVEVLERVLKGLKYADPPEKDQAPVPVISNIWDGLDPDEDYEAEKAKRKPGRPYIIDADDYNENELDRKQICLVYFAGDGVLTDDADQPIAQIDNTVGLANLKRFGAFSKDPRILYVRNEKFDADFEVALHDGFYVKEVLGLEPTMRAG